MHPRRLLRPGIFFFLGYLALSCAAGVFVAEGTLHPGRRLLSDKDEMQAQEMAHRHDSVLANVAIPAGDGATLSAWSRCRQSRTFARLRRNHRFPASARLPMTVSGSSFTLARGWGEPFCALLSRWHLAMPDGSTR